MKNWITFSILVVTTIIFFSSLIAQKSFAISLPDHDSKIANTKVVDLQNNYKTPINMAAVVKNTSVSLNDDLNKLNSLLQKTDVTTFYKVLGGSLDKAYAVNRCETSVGPSSTTIPSSHINHPYWKTLNVPP
jgi:hypothetical protein